MFRKKIPLTNSFQYIFLLLMFGCYAIFFTPCFVSAQGAAENATAQDFGIAPIPFTEVSFDDTFWTPRLETNRATTIPYCFEKCEDTGRLENFRVAGGLKEGTFEGIYFNDSDVYKIIEGAAYTLAIQDDPEMQAYLDKLIAEIAAAQEDDGYLYTCRTINAPNHLPPGGAERWTNPGGHELYCVGHLYEGAVAHYQATGKRNLLDVALKSADFICKTFGPGEDQLHWPPGHQEIEIGLVRLYRLTSERKYLDTAKYFLDQRGNRERGKFNNFGEYSQDHLPVTDQTRGVGHAVRAMYMYTGMADVAALTDNPDYIRAIETIWGDVVGKKLYVTGGIGAAGGHEGFDAPYNLPNPVAYCETCAAIGMVIWNERMFLLSGDAKYIDVLERTLYNGLISGVSLQGDSFFYPNPLESIGGRRRQPWFGCSCCPSNVSRFIASVPGYVYANENDTLYTNLYVGGEGTVPLTSGDVTLTQETNYPWDGNIKMTVTPEKAGQAFALKLRIPGWARNEAVPDGLYTFLTESDEKPTLTLNGKPVDMTLSNGYVTIDRPWSEGDTLQLVLPMPVRRVIASELIEEDRGKTALQRGPIVYCFEGVDQPDGQVISLMIPDDATFASEMQPELLGGVVTLSGMVDRVAWKTDAKDGTLVRTKVPALAIPYYAWAHRELCDMAVWIAREDRAARPTPGDTIASTSKATASHGDPRFLADQIEPKSKNDHACERTHWWPNKGDKEWMQYEFARPEKVSQVEVYWFDDTGRGECRVPASWKLLYRDSDGQWQEVGSPDGYGVEKDRYNVTTFTPVETDALRLDIQSQDGWAGGIHEWRVNAVGSEE